MHLLRSWHGLEVSCEGRLVALSNVEATPGEVVRARMLGLGRNVHGGGSWTIYIVRSRHGSNVLRHLDGVWRGFEYQSLRIWLANAIPENIPNVLWPPLAMPPSLHESLVGASLRWMSSQSTISNSYVRISCAFFSSNLNWSPLVSSVFLGLDLDLNLHLAGMLERYWFSAPYDLSPHLVKRRTSRRPRGSSPQWDPEPATLYIHVKDARPVGILNRPENK